MTQSQVASKWTTSGSGNIYTKWDSNVIVKDSGGLMVQLNQRLKKQDQYEEQIGRNDKGENVWYRVREANGVFLIYAQTEQKRAEYQQKSQSGGLGGRPGGGQAWYKVVDADVVDSKDAFIFKITQERWSAWGNSFADCTQVVNGKLVWGICKKEKIQPGGSSASEPAEAAPPV